MQTYSEKAQRTSAFSKANEDSNIKNRRFYKDFHEIHKSVTIMVKYNKVCNKDPNRIYDAMMDMHIEKYNEQKNKLTDWLKAKTVAIPYGSMYDQQEEERCVYHKDHAWAEKKLAKLTKFVKHADNIVDQILTVREQNIKALSK